MNFFLVIAIILIPATVYFSLRRIVKCGICHSKDVSPTGEKRYNEDPVTIMGSPSSYHEVEYKCSKCGNVFWKTKKAVIFN